MLFKRPSHCDLLLQAVCPTCLPTPRRSATRTRSVVSRPPPSSCWGSSGRSSGRSWNPLSCRLVPGPVDRLQKVLDWLLEDPTTPWPDTPVSGHALFLSLCSARASLSPYTPFYLSPTCLRVAAFSLHVVLRIWVVIYQSRVLGDFVKSESFQEF